MKAKMKFMTVALLATSMFMGMIGSASAATIYVAGNPNRTFTWSGNTAGSACTVDGQAGVVGFYNVNGANVQACVVGIVAPQEGGYATAKVAKGEQIPQE